MTPVVLTILWAFAAQEAAEEFPSRDRLTIEIVHDGQATCAEYPKSFRCSETVHWVVMLNGVRCGSRTRGEAFIKSEAARHKSPDPQKPAVSILPCKVLGESGAPYSHGESVLAACAAAGITKLEIGEKKAGPEAAITSALGVGAGLLGDNQELMILIGKQDPQEKFPFRWVDAAGLKEAVEAAAKDRGPRDELPAVLKPVRSTPWAEVMQVMKVCKDMGFDRIDLAAPFTMDDLPKK